MECYKCGTLVDGEDFCPHCGADIHLYRRILRTADAYYNEGLERAQVRDLSGAIESLRKSLSYNKYHTQARNLLGLVYFEIGEIVTALSEWVISKSLQPADNPQADRYLDEIQKSPGMLDKMNQTIKKYNQALTYCHQDSRDLATIQLRKVLGLNPKFVAGHQLLALLYIQDQKFDEALKALQAANRIDVKNTRTLRYLREVKEQIRLRDQNKKKKKKKDDAVAFKDGNETIVMPQNSFRDMLDNTRASIVNILVGLVIGLLICFFLIVPTVRENAANDAANALVDANEELANSNANVSTLQNQVEQLQQELENYTGKADVVTSYEKVMEAQEAVNNGDFAAAGTALSTVNRDLMSDRGKAAYDAVITAVNAQTLEENEAAGRRAFRNRNYEEAITAYLVVVGIDENYREGQVLYNLAESYREIGDTANARTYYEKVIAAFPDSSYARNAQNRLEDIAATEATQQNTGDAAGQTTQQNAGNTAGQTTQ